VAVTLIWRAPSGTAPRDARVRLVPVGASTTGAPTLADVALIPSPPDLYGGSTGAAEIIITRALLPFPAGADTADAQLALNAAGGGPDFGDFVDLNRVAYRLEGAP
jgi:hypothetical protein